MHVILVPAKLLIEKLFMLKSLLEQKIIHINGEHTADFCYVGLYSNEEELAKVLPLTQYITRKTIPSYYVNVHRKDDSYKQYLITRTAGLMNCKYKSQSLLGTNPQKPASFYCGEIDTNVGAPTEGTLTIWHRIRRDYKRTLTTITYVYYNEIYLDPGKRFRLHPCKQPITAPGAERPHHSLWSRLFHRGGLPPSPCKYVNPAFHAEARPEARLVDPFARTPPPSPRPSERTPPRPLGRTPPHSTETTPLRPPRSARTIFPEPELDIQFHPREGTDSRLLPDAGLYSEPSESTCCCCLPWFCRCSCE